MGLRGTVSVGLPTTTSIYHRDIDYSDAIREAVDEFMDAATSDVPVDTGTLQASISCEVEYMGFTAYADTNYAEYVEYGTYKMEAQPYFEDNLESVAEELHANCVEIWQDAEQQDKEQYQAQIEARMQEAQRLGALDGSLIEMVLSSMLIGLLNGLLSIVQDMFSMRNGDNTEDTDQGYSADVDIY